ncbi:hypothetical protein K431DRAFT_320601 [Polychaeton citri CBS 116435]|uniref:Nuclear pore complex component n=1 Tax=Polychaeton citri CBS 116435 TaxID=1314669 RepID=A0A9P4Q7X5_9PEZI|nr:hypothetical protein K431DRAFT_320601 [Polychaeton citri CBS 116435]
MSATSRALTSTTSSLLQSPSSKAHTITTAQELNRSPSSALTPSKVAATARSVLPSLNLTQQKTPARPQAGKNSLQAPSPVGKWQHPRLEEIIRRRDRTNFDERNVHAAIINTALMLSCLSTPHTILPYLPASLQSLTQPYLAYTLYALSLLFLSNTILALAPYKSQLDPCEDVPLTPSQRRLLGLPPMSRPATPQEKDQWITPPRYSRSTTPRGDSSGGGMFFDVQGRASPLSRSRGNSPPDNSLRMSGYGAESSFASSSRRDSGSQFSPSPLKEKILRGGFERRRSSFGMSNGSPLGLGEFDGSSSSRFDTPSKKAGVSLNSKWLYEKGRGSPGARSSVLI